MDFPKPFTVTFTVLLTAKSMIPSNDLHTHIVYHAQNLPRAIGAINTTSGTGVILGTIAKT